MDVYPAISKDFLLSLRVVVGITCLLSVFGASLIVFTYAVFKDLRTLARQMLVNLSVADIMVAASHFVGLVAKVERFIPYYAQDNNDTQDNATLPTTDPLCSTQAAFTMYGSISSFLWTVGLGAYMLMVIVLRRPDFAKYFVFVCYLVCWGVPLTLVLWFALIQPTYLGFAEGADVAWCYIRLVPRRNGTDNNGTDSHSATLLAQLVGYDMWVYATFIILPALYLTMLCYLRYRGLILYRAQAKRTTDLKLIFVPLIFLLLRVWSAVLDIPVFFDTKENEDFRETKANAALVFIAGIGDSAQGLANAILFCWFTQQVRIKLLKTIGCNRIKFCREKIYISLSSTTSITTHETTTQLDSDSVRSWNSGINNGSHAMAHRNIEDETQVLLSERSYDRDSYGSKSFNS